MIPANETFEGTFEFKPHFSTAAGFRMHYVDEGEGKPIMCLHGEPTWSYLYRQIIPQLAQRHRVIVPDYMGFGKSETLQDREYTPKAHLDNLEALVLELNLRHITLVLHDWGGVIGGGLALRHPERIARIVVINSLLPLGLAIEQELLAKNNAESKYFRWMTALYQDGMLDTVLGNFGVIILSVMKQLQGFERISNVNQTWLRAYSEPFATPEECVGAISFPKSIVSGSATFEKSRDRAIAAVRSKPAMMIMGMQDRVLLPKYFIPMFEAGFPNGSVIKLENAGHFCQEDQPDTLAALIHQFTQLM